MNGSTSPTIDFTADNYARIAKGKRTTIRLGDKAYHLGPCDFSVEGIEGDYAPVITEVRKTRFVRLTHQDALEDGFIGLPALRDELGKLYDRFISDFEVVSVVRFEV